MQIYFSATRRDRLQSIFKAENYWSREEIFNQRTALNEKSEHSRYTYSVPGRRDRNRSCINHILNCLWKSLHSFGLFREMGKWEHGEHYESLLCKSFVHGVEWDGWGFCLRTCQLESSWKSVRAARLQFDYLCSSSGIFEQQVRSDWTGVRELYKHGR